MGEYLLMSEDEPDGNLMLGVSRRSESDNLDHIALYKLLPEDDGTEYLYKLTDQAMSAIITPPMSSVNDLKASKRKSLSVSLSYGSLIATSDGDSAQVTVCLENQYYAEDQCLPCDPGQGASGIQATSCTSCEQMRRDSANDSSSIMYYAAYQLCEDSEDSQP